MCPPFPDKVALFVEDFLDHGVAFLHLSTACEFVLKRPQKKKHTSSVDRMPPCPRNGVSMRSSSRVKFFLSALVDKAVTALFASSSVPGITKIK